MFKVGDKVCLSESLAKHAANMGIFRNIGTVIKFSLLDFKDLYEYKVEWDNGEIYAYDDHDLQLAIPYINEQKLKKALGI